ncbi:MAG: M14 family metallocarboxypeptidase [Verrucomicrobia bacterium]|nr:M14 family metallocarboxypeptidase [Verrucomicrobiota bacterium]
MERLGKNIGRYGGETIAIERRLKEIQAEALKTGWRAECILDSETIRLPACHRGPAVPRKRLYLSSGIHGDEPAGPMAILQLMRENSWPEDIEIRLCPCLNPAGFALNRRENADGIDFNRDYRQLSTNEIRAHVTWLQQQPNFDLAVVLHEDWEANGFYLYELNPSSLPSLAETVIRRVAEVCPIEHAQLVDNWPCQGGIIRPKVNPKERPQWAEAIYLISHKTRQSYTLEAPSDYPLSIRVAGLVAGVRTLLELLLSAHRQVRP